MTPSPTAATSAAAETAAAFASAPQAALPPHAADEPVFGAPWQAQAFALVLQLHQRGLFSWSEWAQALAEQVRAADVDGHAHETADQQAHDHDHDHDHAHEPAHVHAHEHKSEPDAGDVYYGQWLLALETLLVNKGVTSAQGLAELRQRWADAAADTPHGQSIELR